MARAWSLPTLVRVKREEVWGLSGVWGKEDFDPSLLAGGARRVRIPWRPG